MHGLAFKFVAKGMLTHYNLLFIIYIPAFQKLTRHVYCFWQNLKCGVLFVVKFIDC
jgi:hypothetical protein